MNNPFRNLVKKPAKHEKGGIVVADSGNVKEVAKIMIGFEALLRETQSYMSKACGNKLFDSDLKDAMRQLIKQYMKDHNYYVPHMNLAEAADRLYVEMAEYSFLTPLLARKDIEEININSWDDIQIIPSKGQQYKYSEHFSSAQHAVDVVRRMLHNNKLVFDASRPLVTGYLDKNIRISAIHSLIVGDEVGSFGFHTNRESLQDNKTAVHRERNVHRGNLRVSRDIVCSRNFSSVCRRDRLWKNHNYGGYHEQYS